MTDSFGIPHPVSRGFRLFTLAVGIAGVLLAIHLSLRTSPQLESSPWVPHCLAQWCDHHGKTRNFPAFIMLGLPLMLGVPSRRAQVWALLGVGLLAMLLEIGQFFIPTRTPSVIDVLCSWAGLAVACGLAKAILLLWSRIGQPPVNGVPAVENPACSQD